MEENLSLTEVLKKINKKYSEAVVQVGVPEVQKRGSLSLGSPSLDFCLYNSLPEGTFIEFNGLESSGKTTVACLVAASYTERELQRNPDNPRKILFVDAECAIDKGWIKRATGYDMDSTKVSTVYIQGTGQSAEDYFDDVISLIKTGEIGLIIFDSLSMLVGNQVSDQSLEKEQMGGISKPLTSFVKRSVGLLNRFHTTFIGINGLSQNIGGYGDPLIAGGGKAWKRACMARLRFKRGDFFDGNDNIIKKKDAQSPAGHIIEMYVEKTKVCKWDRKLGFCHLNYDKGIDLIWDTVEVAKSLNMFPSTNDVIFAVEDPATKSTVKDSEGKEVKIRGKNNLGPYLKGHPDLGKRIYDRCYEILSQKEDSNVQAFETLLGIDIKDKLGYELNESEDDGEIRNPLGNPLEEDPNGK